jgi:catechol 2,3-dioxygenase
MTNDPTPEPGPQVPLGLNHLVLNVRDIEQSHHFWSGLLGFRHVGTSRSSGPDGQPPMRFYSGERDGKLHHHDIALYQTPASGSADRQSQSLDHLAIEYASEESWLTQIRFLTERGVKFHRRVERGATHSIHFFDPNGIEVELVFELPREQWESDIDGVLNRRVDRPITG